MDRTRPDVSAPTVAMQCPSLVDYSFCVLAADGQVMLSRVFPQENDAKALVRSFDLLRDHPMGDKVEVSFGGRILFVRVRDGGKSRVLFQR